MNPTHTTQIQLIARPKADAGLEHFATVEVPLAPLGDGEVMVKHHFLSLDPYMRGRMNEGKSYAEAQALNTVMIGGTVGEVIDSLHPQFAIGDKVVGMGGWQTVSVVNANQPGAIRKVDTTHIPLSAYLGAVGMPGVTAWVGLNRILEAKAGQTVLVSAASGAVGSVVGQLAKQRGCKAIGIAGGPAKCQIVIKEYGFDACIDHREHPTAIDMGKAIKALAPEGIDAAFENVGGHLLDAAMHRCNAFARIALCGMIAGYNGAPIPMSNPQLILTQRLTLRGFIVSEHLSDWGAALQELGSLVAQQKLKYRESVAVGLASAPEAFLGLLQGRNVGKQLVRLI